MSVPAALKFKYQDYALLPEDRRYEVIDGELFVTPAPTTRHQLISQQLEEILAPFIRSNGLGIMIHAPYDVVLSEHDILQPDILFVSERRRSIVEEKFVRGAPDLVVEILSPSTASRDREAKAKRYATFGVRELWLVDPEAKTVDVLVNAGEGFERYALFCTADTARSPILPGLEFAVAPVFRPI